MGPSQSKPPAENVITRRRLFGCIPLPLFWSLASPVETVAEQAPTATVTSAALRAEGVKRVAASRLSVDRVTRAIERFCDESAPTADKVRLRRKVDAASKSSCLAQDELIEFVYRVHLVPDDERPTEPLSVTIDGDLVVVVPERRCIVTPIGRNLVL